MTPRYNFQIWATMLIATSMALGALGAHVLRPLLDSRSFQVYETASFYLLIQAVALLWISKFNGPARLLLAGIGLFSGSLYLLSTASLHGLAVSWLGPITPVGGLLVISAWLWAALLIWRAKKQERGT